MKTSTMLSDLIDELIKIHNEHGDMPVISSSNEDNIYSTNIFANVEASTVFPDCLFLEENENNPWGHWRSFKSYKEPLPHKVLHIGSNSPELGEPGMYVNGNELPEVMDFPGSHLLMERQFEAVQEAYEKALNLEE